MFKVYLFFFLCLYGCIESSNGKRSQIEKDELVNRCINNREYGAGDYKAYNDLECAIYYSNLVKLKALVKEGLDFNFTKDDGRNLLHIASKYSEGQIVEYLIDIGIDNNLLTLKSKWSPLDYACRYGNLEAVKLLLENGAKLDGNHSVSQISNAITGSKETTREIIELLIEYGAELNDKEFRPIIRAMGVHQISTLELLLKHGANPNLVDEKG